MIITSPDDKNHKCSKDYFSVLIKKGDGQLEFLKELVSNGIDSYSQKVEVELFNNTINNEYKIVVRDYGKGMSQDEIISYLLLFPGGNKKGDHLFIGEYGTGFAKIFSTKPHGIMVETAKRGEHLKVLIDSDGNYEIYKDPLPFTGTKVVLYINRELYELINSKGYNYLKSWAPHTEVPVYFNDVIVTSPFLPENVLCPVYFNEGETKMALWFSDIEKVSGTFYDHGVTKLKIKSPFPWVNFKIESPYIVLEKPFENSEITGYEYVFQKLKSQGIRRLKEELIHRLVKYSNDAYTPEIYIKYLKLLPKLLSVSYFEDIHEIPFIPCQNDKLISPKTLFEEEKLYFYKTYSDLPLKLEKIHPYIINGKKIKYSELLTLYSIWEINKPPKLNYIENHYLDIIKVEPPENSIKKKLLKLLNMINEFALKDFSGKIFLGKTGSKNENNWPWMFFNNMDLVDLKTINELKSSDTNSFLLIENHPVILKIFDIAEVNMKYALFFLIKSISFSYEVDVDDKKLINDIWELD